MTMGPAPMIRIDLMSVRFGIALRATGALGAGKFDNTAHKKRARFCASSLSSPGGVDPARGVLRPESARKGRATHGLVTALSATRRGRGGYRRMALKRRLTAAVKKSNLPAWGAGLA